MQHAPIPPNESERLAALRRYDILDTPAEADFDDFTRLASQICGTPIATITLIDTARQWFKSNIGMGVSETPRDTSFCGRTILGSEILEVPNALEDERFRDSPLVTGDPNVRFYAGAPLVTPDGQNIGALCVLDRTPHHLTPEQREMLILLSRQVVHLLELRLAGRRIKWLNENLEHLVAKRTEELVDSEERFRQFAEQSSEVFWFVGLNPERILYVSPAVEKIWDLPAKRFYQDPRAWVTSIHADDQERVLHAYATVLSGQSARYETEYRVIRSDDSMRWVLASGTPIRDADGKIIRIGGMAKDITERKRAEESNVRSLALLRATLDSTADGILTIAADRQILSFNETFVKMWRIGPDLLAANNDTLAIRCVLDQLKTPEQFLAKVHHLYNHPLEESFDVLDFKDGRVFERFSRPMLVEGKPVGRVWSFRDVTERKKIEAQFMRAQRMESIGTLAGGIAHDLNNILAPIMMSIDILKSTSDDPQATKILETIEVSAKRGADIVGQVLSFARGMAGERIEVQPRHLLKDLEKIIKDTFPKDVRLEFSIPNDTWIIWGDPTQMHQILLNLCVNARDAMPNGGNLTVCVENCVLDQQYAAMNIQAKPGHYVQISVTDSGTGMPPEVLEKIFEPFFTTKELNKGTGLGLSTVMAIVKGHNGIINVYSEPGKGTTFKVYLPAMETSSGGLEEQLEATGLPRGNGETLLVVDDEVSILTITSQTLLAFGYQVLTATDGAHALAIYAKHEKEIAAVLTDMMMPVMDGPATIHALVRMNPAVKIIAASGLNANGNVAKASGAGVKYFLTKPYTAGTLLKTLRTMLDDA